MNEEQPWIMEHPFEKDKKRSQAARNQPKISVPPPYIVSVILLSMELSDLTKTKQN